MALGTFGDQYKTCKRVLSVFGGERLVDDLAADDFETLRAQIAKTYGKLSRKVEIKRVRSIFRYAYEANLIEKPVRFGPGFVGPSRRELRCERQQNGERMFEAAEIRAMLAAASVPLKAMILLGINCGFGNTDVANLTHQEPRPERRLVQLPAGRRRGFRAAARYGRRPSRRSRQRWKCGRTLRTKPTPIWCSSRRAGQRWVWSRGNTADIDAADIESLAHVSRVDRVTDANGAVAQQARACLAGATRSMRLRHTFETIGGESCDQVAVDAIMGHSRDDMASVYRERIGDDRLRVVVEHVRTWLKGSPPKRQRQSLNCTAAYASLDCGGGTYVLK